ncbi:TolC family protein [Desulfococcus multivorans]|uniref:Outer membrane efflux protein n=2 Tax=Desulfococcus TaxID=896 RepID=S7UH75_DESML|nr:TolC family protein [Desulfococcus multivorans]AOY59709.1 outer membrane efflux protein, TolC-like [Desulfococcus multivorans]AQV01888.1 hypothetical protein B2D07_14700 [Desulfococcus multivorans]EPR33194.1 outer membrane efflux protein [Desulfococcus multivorans DSM 2059]SKA23940.1 Outer membrane protein TolC [Desulfococcus multivorans DSM 2059]
MTRRIAAQFLTLLGVMLLTPGAVPAKQPGPDLPAMTLEACIETALENNPGLTAAREEESVQSEEIVLARSAFLPQVDALAGYTRFSEPMRVIQAHENNEPGVFDRDLLEAGLILQLPLYQGGRRRADLVIADLGRRRAMEIWKRTRQDLILNLHAVFYKILQLDETERSARASMDALESQKETTQLQLDVGRVAPVDLMKIDVRLAEIEQRLSSILADRRVLVVALSQLMGLDAPQGDRMAVRGELKVDPAALPDMDAARKAVEIRRPELVAARLDLDRAEADISAARSAFLPRVDGFGTYGLRSALPYDDEHEDAWAAGLQASLPLFHGGAIRAKVRQAEIRKRQVQERLRAVRLQVETELEQALARIVDSLKRMDVNRKNVALSSETFRIEQAKNEDGKSSINDLLDAQAAMLLAEVAHSQSVMDHLLARVEWRRAAGDPLWPVEKE